MRLPPELLLNIFEHIVADLAGDSDYNELPGTLEQLDLASDSSVRIISIQRHAITVDCTSRRTFFDWPVCRVSTGFLYYVLQAAARTVTFIIRPRYESPTSNMKIFMRHLTDVLPDMNEIPPLHYSIIFNDDHKAISPWSTACDGQTLQNLTLDGHRTIDLALDELRKLPLPIRSLHVQFKKQWQYFPGFHSAFMRLRRSVSCPVYVFYRLRPSPGNPIGPLTYEQDRHIARMVSEMKDKGPWNRDRSHVELRKALFYHRMGPETQATIRWSIDSIPPFYPWNVKVG